MNSFKILNNKQKSLVDLTRLLQNNNTAQRRIRDQ